MLISVIIPVYNDSDGIDQTLHSVTQQAYSDYEIIPVDNNSTDETPSVINKWADCYDRIRPTAERAIQSSYAARNAGIKHAQGEILVFIDADMTVPEGWLQRIAAEFEATNVDYLGYEIEVYVPEGKKSLWGWYDQIMGLPSRYHFKEKQFVPTACLAVRKTVVDKVGPFNPQLMSGGDREFGHRVRDHPDLTMRFSDNIVVFHPARTTFNEHCTKAMRIGRGLVQVRGTSEQIEDTRAVLADLFDHLLPPDPRRIYQRGKGHDLSPSQYVLLYAMDSLIRYVRLYGALICYVNQDTNAE